MPSPSTGLPGMTQLGNRDLRADCACASGPGHPDTDACGLVPAGIVALNRAQERGYSPAYYTP